MSKLESITSVAISRELMDALEDAFPLPKITDHRDFQDIEAIKWAHAQHAVVEWIKTRVNIVGKK